MLVSMKALLDHANRENYAVAAATVASEIDARASIRAAEKLNAPIILNVSYGFTPDLVFIGRYLSLLCEKTFVPVAINLDHGAEFSHAVLAIRGGFTSVMIDRSMLPFEENVAQVRELVKVAHSAGVSVEAELGHVGWGNNYEHDRKSGLTDPAMAKRYIEETGVDCLAVAIGTAHGTYTSTPYLDFERLEEIKRVTGNFPLVLHGASGTGSENLRKACTMGINKVNICNDVMRYCCEAVRAADISGNDVYKLWDILGDAYQEKMEEAIEIFGGVNKAWVPEKKSIIRFEGQA